MFYLTIAPNINTQYHVQNPLQSRNVYSKRWLKGGIMSSSNVQIYTTNSKYTISNKTYLGIQLYFNF